MYSSIYHLFLRRFDYECTQFYKNIQSRKIYLKNVNISIKYRYYHKKNKKYCKSRRFLGVYIIVVKKQVKIMTLNMGCLPSKLMFQTTVVRGARPVVFHSNVYRAARYCITIFRGRRARWCSRGLFKMCNYNARFN